MAPQQRPPASSALKPPSMLPAAAIIGRPVRSRAAGGRTRRSTCSGEGVNRQLGVRTQRSGGTSGIVQTELRQCGPTPDIRRFAGKSGKCRAYRHSTTLQSVLHIVLHKVSLCNRNLLLHKHCNMCNSKSHYTCVMRCICKSHYTHV